MKKVLLGLAVVLGVTSCSTSGNASSTLNTITKVAQISSTVSEISNILGGLNLTSAQSTIVTSALKNYISNYNTLDTTKANYQSLLNNYKSEALGSIKTGIGATKYGQFLSALQTATQNTNSSALSNSTVSIISSLIK